MDAAIAWLVQTILATLLIDKLDAWIRQVGLADDVEKLKSEIRRVKMVVSAVKARGVRNETLDESLALLVERLYEADDVVDELDYYRLQEQVQGGSTPTARLPDPADPSLQITSNFSVQGVTRDESECMHGAVRVDEISSGNAGVGKLRSMVWEHFIITEKDDGKPVKAVCRRCGNEFKCDTKTNGTSSMKKHLEKEHFVTCTKKPPGAHPPNPSSSCRRKGKRRRSKAWEHFDVTEEENEQPTKARCKYCPTEIKCGPKSGTAGMLNHNKICKDKPGPNEHPLNLSSTGDATANAPPILSGDSSRGKMEVDESVQITAANTVTPWDKAELSNRIQKIADLLQCARGEVSEFLELHGSDSTSSSDHHRSTTSDQHLRTSSLVPRKVHGRVVEKNYIKKLIMTEDNSDNVTVVPIVGIAGVGKTALSQLVYNDPDVEKQFHYRIWVSVSRNFDEMRLTKEMLSFVSLESHEEIGCFVKLQEILKRHVKSKRVLLILDDVWDDKNNCRWNQLLAPFKPDNANGSVIIVTTRKPSVAKMIGTTGTIKLGALENDDFWLLFKSCAFSDGNYECPRNISTIGRQIAHKLKGNPLAAVTAGALLRDHLTVDHWSTILKKEHWKSLGLSGGIMSALKFSYDELPYHLQQCFSYCSIFPEKYVFLGKDLVYMWISQGFVHCTHLTKRLEETGWEYLNDLVNMGFFQQIVEPGEEDEYEDEDEESSLGSQTWYSMCGLMHDLARKVSMTKCATIDGLRCNEMLPTIRHLSVVTDSAYNKDQHGNIPRNEMFEKNLRNIVASVSTLRTLVLLGHYDSYFIQVFQHIFRKAQNLRLLHVSTPTVFGSFWCGLANPVHLRYLKLKLCGDVPQVLSKFFHLQVLDVGAKMDASLPNGMQHLVSMRHLVAEKGLYFSIASIGSMTSLQELHDFQIQISSGFEITQLKYMNELVHLRVAQLENVKTREEAYGAGLRNKEHLEELQLSWKHTSSENEYVNDTGYESSVDTAKEVLEGLEPHTDLKHLHIYRYNGSTSPTWLANNISVTSLQTLHLDDCGRWQILPSLESLPFLTKLKLSRMHKVIEVLVPSLEELVLVQMPKLERCLCTSIVGLYSTLRVLQIDSCQALKEFDLFENNDKFEIEQMSCLSIEEEEISLSVLISTKEDSSSENPGDALTRLARDGPLHVPLNLISPLKKVTIKYCDSLRFNGSKEGFSRFTSLEKLIILDCADLFLSLVHTTINDNQANGRLLLPKSLIEFHLEGYSRENLQPCFLINLTSLKKLEVRWSPDLESLQLHSCMSLENLTIAGCESLTLTEVEGLQPLRSLRHLNVSKCPGLPPHLGSFSRQGYELCHQLETLTIDDPSVLATSLCKHLTSLQRLTLLWLKGVKRLTDEQERALVLLKSLQDLTFHNCFRLVSLPGELHALLSLKRLEIIFSWGISKLPKEGLPLSLEELEIFWCTKELADQCRLLETSKLKVKIK